MLFDFKSSLKLVKSSLMPQFCDLSLTLVDALCLKSFPNKSLVLKDKTFLLSSLEPSPYLVKSLGGPVSKSSLTAVKVMFVSKSDWNPSLE